MPLVFAAGAGVDGAVAPPCVEYSLTDRGEVLILILNRTADWATGHLDDRTESPAPAEAPSDEPAPNPAGS
jgi:DNA-binding HxlR family transcriptional regulator